MKCRYCKMRLVGMEEVDGICFDCQESVEDAENLNEINRYREIFPVPPWSTDPITHEICELLGMVEVLSRQLALGDIVWHSQWGLSIVQDATKEAEWEHATAGQFACLIAAWRNNAKH